MSDSRSRKVDQRLAGRNPVKNSSTERKPGEFEVTVQYARRGLEKVVDEEQLELDFEDLSEE